LDRRLDGPQSRSGRGGEEKNSQPRRESNPRTPIVQPVAQGYTDWAIAALISAMVGANPEVLKQIDQKLVNVDNLMDGSSSLPIPLLITTVRRETFEYEWCYRIASAPWFTPSIISRVAICEDNFMPRTNRLHKGVINMWCGHILTQHTVTKHYGLYVTVFSEYCGYASSTKPSRKLHVASSYAHSTVRHFTEGCHRNVSFCFRTPTKQLSFNKLFTLT
jgi:hypothetical protein